MVTRIPGSEEESAIFALTRQSLYQAQRSLRTPSALRFPVSHRVTWHKSGTELARSERGWTIGGLLSVWFSLLSYSCDREERGDLSTDATVTQLSPKFALVSTHDVTE